ncbi:hypothetical protein EON67_03495 [archaeon]|nr:MAG: hypothetical protein EON67_03495 [archaeon]
MGGGRVQAGRGYGSLYPRPACTRAYNVWFFAHIDVVRTHPTWQRLFDIFPCMKCPLFLVECRCVTVNAACDSQRSITQLRRYVLANAARRLC